MKKLFSILTGVALTAAIFSTTSCTKTCDAGYEGSDCKTEVRAKYVGNWTESGTWTATTSPATNGSVPATAVTVSTATSINDINAAFTFNSVNYSYKRTMGSDGKTFTMSSQTQADGSTLTGSGSFPSATTVSEVITLTYTTPSAFVVTITLTGSKI